MNRLAAATTALALGLTLTASSCGAPAAEMFPTASSLVPPNTRAENGYRHVLRTNVSTRLTGPEVTIVVREYLRGEVVKTRRELVRPVAGVENPVRIVMRSQRAHPRYTVRMVAPPLRPGNGVLLGFTTWRHHAVARLSNGCAYSARGIPACGAYLGQTYGSNTHPGEFEAVMERRLGIRRTYFTASQVESAFRIARRDLAEGRLPWMSFKLPSSWAEMSVGAGDAWARDLAERLGRLGGPVWVAFHHEPEGEGNMDDWRHMQERLAPIIRGQDNLAFTVVLTGWHQLYGDEQYSLDNIWPRGVKIDVAGFDVYNQLGVVKDGVENTEGTDLNASYFAKIAPWARAHDVAWGLAETGFTDRAAELDPHWIARTHGQLVAAGGVAFAYFNTTLHSAAPWHLSTPTKLAGWREAQVDTPLMPPLTGPAHG